MASLGDKDDLGFIRSALKHFIRKPCPTHPSSEIYHVKITINGQESILPPVTTMERAVYNILATHFAHLARPADIRLLIELFRMDPDPYLSLIRPLCLPNQDHECLTTQVFFEHNPRFATKDPREPFYVVIFALWPKADPVRNPTYTPLGTFTSLEASNEAARVAYDEIADEHVAKGGKGRMNCWMLEGMYFFGKVYDETTKEWRMILHQHFEIDEDGTVEEQIDMLIGEELNPELRRSPRKSEKTKKVKALVESDVVF